jgi:hypothetical protein
LVSLATCANKLAENKEKITIVVFFIFIFLRSKTYISNDYKAIFTNLTGFF